MKLKSFKDNEADNGDEDLLEEIKANVERWFNWFDCNFQNYKEMMSFVYKSTVSEADRAILKSIDKPDIEINYLASYIDRLLGEFSHQTPSASVSGRMADGEGGPPVSSKVIEIVEGNLMNILDRYEKYSANCILKQQCVGGFSVLKVSTKYRNSDTFEQDLVIGDGDPTLCFFDIFAKTASKADGEFSGEIYPMPEKEFKRKYPKHADDLGKVSLLPSANFKWHFANGDQKIVVLCDYYCKKYKRRELVLLSDGSSISRKDYNKLKAGWSSIQPIPEVVSSRILDDFYIMRYIFFGDKIIKKEKLDYPRLCYFFVDGNSGPVYDEGSGMSRQVTKSYLKNGVGPQKLLNNTAQSIADCTQNLMRSKMLIEKRAVVDPESWKNIQRISHLQWNSSTDGGEQLPKPEAIVQPNPPSVVMETFAGMQKVMQNTLGSYDAQLGISDQQLSGVAIEKGATQNNANSIPYAKNYTLALTDAVDFIVKMMPTLYKTGATIPVIDKKGNHGYVKINQIGSDGEFDENHPVINYGENDLNITVKSDYSFELQKDRALRTMISMMGVSEAFKKLMESPEGMEAFLDNIDMRSIEKIREAHKNMVMQAKQQPPPPNPVEQEMQLKQEQMMLKKQEMTQKQQKEAMDAKIKMEELSMEKQKMKQEQTMELLELHQASVTSEIQQERIMAEISTHRTDDAVKMAQQGIKAQEHELKYVEQLMKHEDQQHRHARDSAKTST